MTPQLYLLARVQWPGAELAWAVPASAASLGRDEETEEQRGLSLHRAFMAQANGLRLSCGLPAPQTRKMASIGHSNKGGASGPRASSAG